MNPRGKWAVLAVVQMGILLGSLDSSSIFFALPAIAADLGLKLEEIQWVSVAYTITVGSTLPLAGKLADMMGRKSAYLTGFLIFTVASLVSGLVSHPGPLIAMRVFTAFGTAFLLSSSNVITMAVFPREQHGLALGIGATVFSVGVAGGLVLGGLVLHYASWRWLFLLNLPIGLLALAAGAWVFDPAVVGPARPRTQPLDFSGALCLLGGLTTLLLGLQLIAAKSFPAGVLLLGGAVIAGFLFVWSNRRAPDPVLPLSLFQVREMRVGSITRVIMRMAGSGAAFTLTFYLQRNLGLSPFAAGMLMLANVGVFAVAGPLAGHASDRWGARPIITGGLALLLAGAVANSFLPDGATSPTTAIFAQVIVAQALMGLGTALFSPPNTSLAMQSVSREQRGVASGLLWTTTFVGQAGGAAIAALILSSETPAGPVANQRWLFATLAAMLATALWLSWREGRAGRVVSK